MKPLDVFKMKGDMDELKKRIENLRATGYAGGDMASVTLNGIGDTVSIEVSDEAWNLGKQAVLTLIAAASNDAANKLAESKAVITSEMAGKYMSGLDLSTLYGSN